MLFTVFSLHYIKITFSIERENLEHMKKNFKTHQNEYRQEDCADELADWDSLRGPLPAVSFLVTLPPTACSSQGSSAITFSQIPQLLPVVEYLLGTITAWCCGETTQPCRLAKGLGIASISALTLATPPWRVCFYLRPCLYI